MTKAKTEITQNDFGLLRPRAAALGSGEAPGEEGPLGPVRVGEDRLDGVHGLSGRR